MTICTHHTTISNDDDFNKAVLIHASVKFKLSSSTVYTYYYYKYLHKFIKIHKGKNTKKVKFSKVKKYEKMNAKSK